MWILVIAVIVAPAGLNTGGGASVTHIPMSNETDCAIAKRATPERPEYHPTASIIAWCVKGLPR
jgi:hypothetical protein